MCFGNLVNKLLCLRANLFNKLFGGKTRCLKLLFLVFFHFLFFFCNFGTDFFGFPAVLFRFLMLFFKLLAAFLQLAHNIFKVGVFGRHKFPRTVNYAFVHAEALGNCKGVALPGNAHKQAVCGRKSFHIKLAAGIFHPRRLQSVHLDFRIVRGRRKLCAVKLKPLDYRYGKSGALNRVGSGAKLVKQHKASVVRLVQYANGVVYVGRKCRKALLNALLVADIRKHAFKNGNGAAFSRRNHHSAHCHKREQTDGFKRYGFAAGVRSGYYKNVKVAAQGYINRHDFGFVNKRMARF